MEVSLMTIDIVTPTFPESIQEGTIAKWHKRPGEPVARDEVLVDVETDKVVVEVVAPADGSLAEILLPEQAIVHTGDLLARFVASAGGAAAAVPIAAPAALLDPAPTAALTASPAARKIAAEQGVDLSRVAGTGRDGRITKEDVVGHRPGVPVAPASAPQPALAPIADAEVYAQ
jgi:2-oxoglutarate dehydrogenase E2 component (dihydrolipoamide succinyltransferase)